MIKAILIISYIFLLSCSFTKTNFWTQNEKIDAEKRNTTTIYEKEKILKKEFNSDVIIQISKLKSSNRKLSLLSNDMGIHIINDEISNISKFRFSKIKEFDYFEPELNFDGKNFIFFDDKGNLLKFDDNFDLIWKKNFYSKQEKKLKPILTLANNGKMLVVFDNLAKFYSVNLRSGNLIWSKTNLNPFNSQVKILEDKIYSIDLNNILRCFSLKDGSEIWKFKTQNTFLKSTKINSIVINKDNLIFNNSIGDISAVNAKSGSLIWQIPTQSTKIFEDAFSLKMSDLVIKNENLIFSNNKNEFFSVNSKNGLINWKQKINSSVRPAFYENYIFTISNEGYFFVIDSKTGNIIRVTDIFSQFKNKKRERIKPIGFVLSTEKMIVSTNNGRIIKIDISSGKIIDIFKIDNEKISRPFVFNEKILLVKNNSIIRLN